MAKKQREISEKARAAWRKSGQAHKGNLVHGPLRHPEIDVRVAALVAELTAAHDSSCETRALIESAAVSFRAVLAAACRPTWAYLRLRSLSLALTAHQSNLARVLKELRQMRRIAGPPTPSIGDLLAPFRTQRESNEPESNVVPTER